MSGIYIHIPFCKQACHYCDFHFSTQLGRKKELLDALHIELKMRQSEFKDIEVETIYFGGGTPSVLETNEIEDLIRTVYENYSILPEPEITLEANPDDLPKSKIDALAQSPVNRLSIGIQSFYDEDLKLMNRAHNAQEAKQCVEDAAEVFKNITIDLIYGIPGMTNERWISNINTTLELELPHISSYALTVEPKTALKKFIETGKIAPIDEKQSQEQFHVLLELLEANGFINYEISNFGKPGYFSRNNSSYWLGKPYLGIGPSAHSFDGRHRSWNINNNIKYTKAIQDGVLPSEKEHLSITDNYNEYVMTGLRTIWGVSLDRVQTEFGPRYLDYLKQQSKRFLDSGLLKVEGDTLLTTTKGKFLADGMASDLFMVNLDV
ncbi:radical SAM family heme chaperone HemW [Muricauda sp. 2012CJ35-5]|uniref:Heme chaperone HemW n=1 Tax=Flagellimonas spongiicola TaxID=2942208 RepID=A0ABT0PVG5_9FLAO|nr:radical SAM family heme chaperone HemW [Allomuricauda spongiicola]MCL6274702.1 radical SAM family heme chaperone HemW [Allomuricauda spongiicola]